MTLAPELLSPGSLLGKYEILRLLSVGGMGELYLARTSGIEGFEKLVALKRILPEFASRADFEKMLLDEARLMATLHHPNIVQVYDVGRHDGSTFFTMEFVHGENLRTVLKQAAGRRRGLSLANTLWIVSNVAAGLHYAHEKRRTDGEPLLLIHRDVSPNNIMISHDGAPKLVDFGIAKGVSRRAKTTQGAIKGNVRYMSPEQCLGDPMDRRSDIFSLGIVLFELTTGTRWIRERDDYQAVQSMLNQPLPRPSERRKNYSPELEQIVMRALARHPEDRYSTAQELQLDIEAYAREHKLAMSSVVMANTMASLFESATKWSSASEIRRASSLAPDNEHTVPIAKRRGRALAAANPVEAKPQLRRKLPAAFAIICLGIGAVGVWGLGKESRDLASESRPEGEGAMRGNFGEANPQQMQADEASSQHPPPPASVTDVNAVSSGSPSAGSASSARLDAPSLNTPSLNTPSLAASASRPEIQRATGRSDANVPDPRATPRPITSAADDALPGRAAQGTVGPATPRPATPRPKTQRSGAGVRSAKSSTPTRIAKPVAPQPPQTPSASRPTVPVVKAPARPTANAPQWDLDSPLPPAD